MHKCAACNITDPGRSWWDSKNGDAFICTPCGLAGKGKQSAAEIRLKVEGSPAAPPVGAEPRSSATRTKADDLGPTAPAAALRAVTQAAEQLAVSMRQVAEPPESMTRAFRELWAHVWALAGVPPPPLPAAVTGGKGAPTPTRHFMAGAGISKVVAELESGIGDEPPISGRKRFDPMAGLQKAEEDTAARPPRFTVGA